MFPKLVTSAQNAFGKIERSVQELEADLKALEKTRRLSVDISQIRDANRQISEIKSQINSINGMGAGGRSGGAGLSFGRLIGANMLGGLALTAVTMAGSGAMALGRNTLDNGIDVERQQIGLGTFVGDQKAKAIYAQLQDQAVHTPYTTKQMLPTEMGLIAAGLSPERANRDMMSMLNAVASTGGSDYIAELMGMHLAQAASAGKMDGMLMREFQRTAHIPVKALIAQDMYPNLSRQAGMKKVDQLDSISYDRFTHALAKAAEKGGMFADGMDRLSKSISGKWSTIKDLAQIDEAKLTLSQADNIKQLEDMAISALQKAPQLISEITPIITNAFSTIKEFLPDIKEFGGGLVSILRPIGSFLVSDPFKQLAHTVFSVATDLTDVLKPAMVQLAESAKTAAWLLGGIGGAIHEFFHPKNLEPGGRVYKMEEEAWANRPGSSMGQKTLTANERQQLNSILGVPGLFQRQYFKAPYVLGTDGRSITKETTPKLASDQFGAGGDTGSSTDKITGGGKRQIIINNHKPFVEIGEMHVKEMKEGVQDMKRYVAQGILEILQSGANAVGG